MTPQAGAVASAGRTASWRNGALARIAGMWRALILPGAVLAVWSAITDGGLVPKYILPAPGAVIEAAIDFVIGGASAQAYSGSFMVHFWASLKRVLAGFALGSGLAIPLGIVLGYNRRIAAYIEPSLMLMRSIPGICWLPLALIWFGIGTPASIFLISLGSFYAVLISTIQGVKYVEPSWCGQRARWAPPSASCSTR
jgi:ABC-type nitrate/sulfonate/bicarbonate transport system permease component